MPSALRCRGPQTGFEEIGVTVSLFLEADFWPGTTSRHSAFTRSKKYPESRSFFDPNFRVARDPGVSGIDSHKPALVLISQACLRRHLSEMMDRIAKGPEDVKKSVRAADELP